jgi:hypothetical protein
LPRVFSAAFNKHDGRFHEIKFEQLRVAERFLRPDIAIVHWSWTATGDKNPDGSAPATLRHDDAGCGKAKRQLARRGFTQ